MSRATRLLQRLVVVGAGTAAIATGVVPIATGVANAAPPTTMTISPTSDTDTVGNCNPYKVTTNPNATFDVQLTQTSANATTIDFCDVSGFAQFQGTTDNPQVDASNTTAGCGVATAATVPPATPNTATCNGEFTANSSGIVEFGVTSDQPGTMNIVAYNDANNNDQFSQTETPNASATKTWVANTAGGNNAITCSPATATNTVNTNHHWTCQVNTSAGTGVHGDPLVKYNVTSGPDASVADTDCFYDTAAASAGTSGQYGCDLTNGGGIGTDAIFVYADSNNNDNADPGEPSTTIHKTWVNPAPNNAVVLLDCSPREEEADTGSNGGSFCQEPVSQDEITLTATVSAGNAAQSGLVVNFYEDFGSATVNVSDNGQCVTNNSGQCSVTLTGVNLQDGDFTEWYAEVSTANSFIDSNDSEIDWNDTTSNDARNITVSPQDTNQPSGGSQIFMATVVDRFDDPVPGVCVGWNESGPGRVNNPSNLNCINTQAGVTNGTYDTVCATNGAGQCSIEVASNSTESGDETVTATIDSANYNNSTTGQECTAPAGRTYAYGGDSTTIPQGDQSDAADTAGNCTDDGTVTWGAAPPSGKHAIGLHLACFSHHKGKIKCVAQTGPATPGVTVKFFNKKGHKVATDVTNKAGKAHFVKTGKKSGKTYVFQAHANHTATTYSADSKRAKVTVQ